MKPIQRATTLDEAFHHELWAWYWKNRNVVRANYTGLTQRFLDYNAPLEPREKARFLRTPQSEALEMYVFLKERLADRNAGARAWPVYEIFEKWYRKETPFANRSDLLSVDHQLSLVSTFDEAAYTRAFERMRERATQTYGNYIFALTMGTGKTLLMVTCIFYDFLLANTYPKDRRYAHNALIFAPDKTVLATLRRDIEQFDREKVVPREYLPIIDAAEARFLEEDGATLTGLRERFNIIVSNAQKIILRKQGASPSAAARLFAATPHTLELSSSEAMARDLFDTEEVRTETELVTNQRYETLRRMKQLGVFIDEAHHAFGAKLLSDMDPSRPPACGAPSTSSPPTWPSEAPGWSAATTSPAPPTPRARSFPRSFMPMASRRPSATTTSKRSKSRTWTSRRWSSASSSRTPSTTS
jgi:type III restriction enzyme